MASAALIVLATAPMVAAEGVPVGALGLDLLESHCLAPLASAEIPHTTGLNPLDAEKAAQFKRILGLMGVSDVDPEGQEFWVTGSSKLIYVTRTDQPYCVVFGFDAEYLEVQEAIEAWHAAHGAGYLVDGVFALDQNGGTPATASLTHTTPGGPTVRVNLSYDPKLAGLFVAAADRVTP